MSDKAGTLGTYVGLSLVCFLAYLGYQFILEHSNPKLPLKARQAIIAMQDRLPIEIERGLLLEQFDLSSDLVAFTVRIESVHQQRQLSKKQLEIMQFAFDRWFCTWREQFTDGDQFEIQATLLAENGLELATLINNVQNCPVVLPKSESHT
jgi:hypothetical protein